MDATYVRETVCPNFFDKLWQRRMAADKRNYRQLVDTTIEIATKVGGSFVIERIVTGLKDENDAFKKMVMETIEKIVQTLGVSDIDLKLEEILMDSIITAFHD